MAASLNIRNRIDDVLKIVKSNQLIFKLVAAILAVKHMLLPIIQGSTYDSTGTVLLLSLIAWLFYLLVFPREDHYRSFRVTVYAGMLLLATFLIINFIINPVGADALEREDGLLENIQALALFTGSLLMVFAAAHLIGKRQTMVCATALLVGVVFFILGAEEISWGQRILGLSSPEYFLDNNMQQEINLHNFKSGTFNAIYYMSGAVLLVALPLFHRSIKRFAEWLNLRSIVKLLPSSWLALPFLLMGAFTVSLQTFWSALVFMICLFAALYFLVNSLRSGHAKLIVFAGAAMAVLLVGTFVFSIAEYGSGSVHKFAHTPYEFRETFIALGVMAYGVDLVFRLRAPKRRVDKLQQ